MRAGAAAVKGEVDQDRHRDAASRGDHGNRKPTSLAQLADIELSPGLKPQDHEKQGHQPLIDQVTKVQDDPGTANADHDPRRPCRLIRVKPRRVRPQQRGDRARQHHNRTGALSAQKAADRRCEVPRPRRPATEEIGLRVAHRCPNITLHREPSPDPDHARAGPRTLNDDPFVNRRRGLSLSKHVAPEPFAPTRLPSLSTSGETLTIEESMNLEGENGARRNVGDGHEWSCG